MRTPNLQAEDLAATVVAKAAAGARGIKTMPPAVNGVVTGQLLSMTRKHMPPPYLNLLLGLPSNVLKEIRKDLLKLNSVDPKAAKRLLVLNALLSELAGAAEAAAKALAEGLDTPDADDEFQRCSEGVDQGELGWPL
jgi:hypothetical protein